MLINAMVFCLADFPDKSQELFELIEKNFPKGSEQKQKKKIEDEFFLLLNPKNRSRVFFRTHNNEASGRIISSASYRIFNFSYDSNINLKVAGIGLVVTDKEHRGRGHSDAVQKHIENLAQKEGASLAVLWSDLDEFYKKRGYWPAGTEIQYDARDLDLSSSKSNVLRIENRQDFLYLEKLYAQYSWGPQRDWNDYVQFLELSESYAYGVKDAHGAFRAYILIGKGRDLRNCVHELIGSPNDILDCVAYALNKHSLQKIMLPFDEVRESHFSKVFDQDSMRSAMAYFKILNLESLVLILSKLLPEGLSLFKVKEGFELKKTENILFSSSDSVHLLQLFLGPWRVEEMEDVPENLKHEMKSWVFPRLYFWGMDSV